MTLSKIISFDAEGTLVTTEFSRVVWRQALPELYAKKKGISTEQAQQYVTQEYERVGEHQPEWYDISYWLNRWELGDYQSLLQNNRHLIQYYPETKQILTQLSNNKRNIMIVSSASARQFLDVMMEEIGSHFAAVFSSISDYGQPKTADFYREVCQAMNAEPQDIIHVGDSWDFDFLAPRELGIRTFYLDRQGTRQGPSVVRDLQEFQGKVKVLP